jgi:hypothetical protein
MENPMTDDGHDGVCLIAGQEKHWRFGHVAGAVWAAIARSRPASETDGSRPEAGPSDASRSSHERHDPARSVSEASTEHPSRRR